MTVLHFPSIMALKCCKKTEQKTQQKKYLGSGTTVLEVKAGYLTWQSWSCKHRYRVI